MLLGIKKKPLLVNGHYLLCPNFMLSIICVRVFFSDKTIAFSAVLSHSFRTHNHKPVVYDDVRTNKGLSYDAASGIFTAPEEGTFVIIWHTITFNTGSGHCYLWLYKNGVKFYSMITADAQDNTRDYTSASMSAILALEVGDTLGIRTDECNYLGGFGGTSFSGFRI